MEQKHIFATNSLEGSIVALITASFFEDILLVALIPFVTKMEKEMNMNQDLQI